MKEIFLRVFLKITQSGHIGHHKHLLEPNTISDGFEREKSTWIFCLFFRHSIYSCRSVGLFSLHRLSTYLRSSVCACLMQLLVYPHFYIPVINTNHLSVYLCRSPICVLSFKPFSQFSLNHPLSLCLFFLFIRVSIFWVKDIPRKATPKTTQRISFQKAKNRKFTFQWRWKRSFLWKYLQIFHQVFPLTAFLRKRFNKNVTSVAN